MEPAGSTFFWSLVLFLLLAPIYKASNRALPLLLLELAAIAFLFSQRAALRAEIAALPKALTGSIAVLLVYPLLQLVPLPDALWRLIPGHSHYVAVVEQFTPSGTTHWRRAISVVPTATEAGWLALLPPAACFFAVQRLAHPHVVRLLLALGIFTGAEALLGLLQVRAGRDSIFYWLSDIAHGTSAGTFVNHNHFAALLAMMLPVVLGLLVYTIRYGRRRLLPPAFAFDPDALSQRVIIFISAALILVCLLFTRSRAGIATALAGLVLSSLLLGRTRSGLRYANWIVGALVVAGMLVAGLIGLSPLLLSFSPEQLGVSGEGRIALSAATLRAAIEFLPFGSGLSTFADVFPRFQADVFGGYIDHAHNDYLQLFMEVGLAAPVIVALGLAAYVMRMSTLLSRSNRRSFTVLQIASGVGLLPMVLHSMFDFALHMPANAMWFATLAGVMFHRGVEERKATVEPSRRGERAHETVSEP